MAGGATLAPKSGTKTNILKYEIMIFGLFMKFQIKQVYLIYQVNFIETRGVNIENLVRKGLLASFLPISQYKIDAVAPQAKILLVKLVQIDSPCNFAHFYSNFAIFRVVFRILQMKKGQNFAKNGRWRHFDAEKRRQNEIFKNFVLAPIFGLKVAPPAIFD